jgi:GNAT superfamily N-acetyltransferase
LGRVQVRVVEVPVEATFALRDRLLRRDRPDLGLRIPDDGVAGTFHLAVLDTTGAAVGVMTLTPAEPEFAARPPAWRLRQMAVDPGQQRQGLGSALFAAALTALRARGAATLWAESRDASLSFYLAQGMAAVPGRQHTSAGVVYSDVTLDLGLSAERDPQPATPGS